MADVASSTVGAALAAVALVAAVPVVLVISVIVRAARAEIRCAPSDVRCRGCGYLLLGLSEPRCPECGVRFELPGVLGDAIGERDGATGGR